MRVTSHPILLDGGAPPAPVRRFAPIVAARAAAG